MRDIGERASLDFAVLAIGFAKEDGGRGLAVGDGGHVHAYIIPEIMAAIQKTIALLHAYIILSKFC